MMDLYYLHLLYQRLGVNCVTSVNGVNQDLMIVQVMA